MKKNIYKVLLGCSFLLLILSVAVILLGHTDKAGPLVIACLMLFAIGARGFDAIKGFAYTIWIFTAVSASMFYPQYFTAVGSFKLSILIVPLLQIIMFGMGSQMSLKDFTGIVKMPRSVIIGVGAQFTIMPFVAFAISRIFNFPPEIAAGIILIGCVPSGLASNVMSYIAHANLPLSVTIGSIATLLSPVLTPLLMRLLAGQYIAINVWSMMLDILNMIILPIVAGFIFNLFYSGKESSKSKAIQLSAYFIIIALTSLVDMISKESGIGLFLLSLLKSMCWFCFGPIVFSIIMRILLKGDRRIIESVLSFLSMAGIALIITIITAAGRDSLLNVGALLLVTSLLHNSCGYALGYSAAWLFRMPEKDRRTIALEVGMQNGGLASGLAMQMGKVATVGLAPAVFGPLMNITGSVLASWWRRKLPPEDLQPARDNAPAS
ncbi:MAG: bile acid:sodium symporter family protein [Tannerellaceae bacterium]|jgi:BASS family bile acid:Na+ symporter|nr:bile acid:sodium symporter family protein [Tannerellaceae bacterium]